MPSSSGYSTLLQRVRHSLVPRSSGWRLLRALSSGSTVHSCHSASIPGPGLSAWASSPFWSPNKPSPARQYHCSLFPFSADFHDPTPQRDPFSILTTSLSTWEGLSRHSLSPATVGYARTHRCKYTHIRTHRYMHMNTRMDIHTYSEIVGRGYVYVGG